MERTRTVHAPIENLLALVTVVDSGSVSKAARTLGLTQSAVSAEMKRLRQIFGEEIFDRSNPGLRLTEGGETLVRYARQILALSDQLLVSMGTPHNGRPVRVGLPAIYAETHIAVLQSALADNERLQMHLFPSKDLVRALLGGYLDVAFVFDDTDVRLPLVARWQETMVWVSGPKRLLSPGAPVPLVMAPGSIADKIAMNTLDNAGIPYVTVFKAVDATICRSAVRAGVGYMISPRQAVSHGLRVAKEPYLPELPALTAAIYTRQGIDQTGIRDVLDALSASLGKRAALAVARHELSK